jgi:NADH-quinone oxidoreductase subunit L
MTAFYMFRLYASTFLGNFRGTEDQGSHLHESPAAMTIPLIVLALLAVVGGWVGIPEIFMENGHALANFLAPVFQESTKLQSAHQIDHSTEYLLMGISVAIALIAIFIAINRFRRKPDLQEPAGLAKVVANKWYVDELYQGAVVKPANSFARFLNKTIEKNLIDWIVNGVGRLLQYSSRQLRWIQSGLVGSYVLLMVISILIFFIIQFFV